MIKKEVKQEQKQKERVFSDIEVGNWLEQQIKNNTLSQFNWSTKIVLNKENKTAYTKNNDVPVLISAFNDDYSIEFLVFLNEPEANAFMQETIENRLAMTFKWVKRNSTRKFEIKYEKDQIKGYDKDMKELKYKRTGYSVILDTKSVNFDNVLELFNEN